MDGQVNLIGELFQAEVRRLIADKNTLENIGGEEGKMHHARGSASVNAFAFCVHLLGKGGRLERLEKIGFMEQSPSTKTGEQSGINTDEIENP